MLDNFRGCTWGLAWMEGATSEDTYKRQVPEFSDCLLCDHPGILYTTLLITHTFPSLISHSRTVTN